MYDMCDKEKNNTFNMTLTIILLTESNKFK